MDRFESKACPVANLAMSKRSGAECEEILRDAQSSLANRKNECYWVPA